MNMTTKIYNLNSSIEPGRISWKRKGSLSFVPDMIAIALAIATIIVGIVK
jgi:hypothetical protein